MRACQVLQHLDAALIVGGDDDPPVGARGSDGTLRAAQQRWNDSLHEAMCGHSTGMTQKAFAVRVAALLRRVSWRVTQGSARNGD